MAAAWPPHIAAVMLDFSNLGLGIDSAAMLTRMSPSEELDGFHIGRQDAGTPAAVASSTSTAAAAASPNPPATVSATSPEDGGRVPTPSATPTLSASSPTSPGAAAITGQAMIWDPYIQNMLTCISALNMAAKAAQKQGLEPLAITAVNAIYVILVATGTDRLDHPAVKSNAEIMTLFYSAQRHLNKLILATKIAAGVWPPPDAMAQLRFQIGQLLIFMQTFVSQCYTFRIQILPGPVEPARLFAEDGTLLVSDPGTFRLIPFFDVDFVPRLEHQSDAVMSCIAELVRIITPDITLDADLSAMSPQRSPQRSPQTSPKLSPQCSPQRFPHMVVRAVASPFSTPSGSPLLSRAVSSPAGLTAPRWDAGASAGGLPEVALRRTRELVVEMGRLLSLVENLGQHLIPDPGSRPSSQFMRHSDESALLSERDVTSMLGTDTPHEIYINFVTQRELLCNNISTLLTIAQSWQDGVMNTDDAMTQMLETTAEVLATMEDMLVATKMLLDQRCSLIQRHVTQSLMLSHVPLRNGTATTTVTITALPSPAASPLHDCSSTSSASSASATSHTMLSSSSLHAPLIHQRRLHRLTMKDLEALHLRAKSLSCLPTHSAASVDHDALVLSATNSDTPSLVPASSTASSIHSDATSVSDVCSRHHVHDADADASLPSPIAALTKPHHRHAYDAAMRLMRPAAAPAPVPAPAAAPVTPRSRLSSALHPLRTSTTVHAAVHHAAIAIHPGTLDPAQAHVRDHVLQRTASLNNDHRLSLMDRRSHALSADPLGIDVGAARTGKPARQDMKLARFFGARELDVSHFQRHKQKELARKFWFLGYDAPTTDISMNMEGQVRGGTLEALVERLTVHDQLVDPSYTNTFFLMMHQFTPSPGQVLRLLIGRYNLVCPAALTADEAAIWREQKLVPVRLRVYNALKIWLEHHWTVQDDAILPDLDHFIRTDVAQHQPLLVWRLLDLLERRDASDARAGRLRPGRLPQPQARDGASVDGCASRADPA
ncbi:hypothetical protein CAUPRSCDRAFT_11749 [Caulochytrium protostelioides]|uniref:N-terminal Ras-GEF domain-containing protein n=1 Tax=Caulochytrium protostelioides TaxID=1555241 RepID=A0A4P9WTI1_9FUNG|nr:hypothetical protein CAUPRSCDRAFT_11749 [Caulochytrium protostelioides]